ncbi:hypothetical protein F385_625 [Pantoea agglomerans 299R]|nr:hypothetical protein F385_625 [Pantoea agglomerans 299R]
MPVSLMPARYCRAFRKHLKQGLFRSSGLYIPRNFWVVDHN